MRISLLSMLIFVTLQSSFAGEVCARTSPHPLVKSRVSDYSMVMMGQMDMVETFKQHGKIIHLKQHLCRYYTLEYLFELNDIRNIEVIQTAVDYLKSISSIAPFLIESIIYTISHTPEIYDISVPITDMINDDVINISIKNINENNYLSIRYTVKLL